MLLEIPIAESKNAKKRFSDNKMIVNLDRFKSIIIQKKQSNNQTKTVFSKKRYCRNCLIN